MKKRYFTKEKQESFFHAIGTVAKHNTYYGKENSNGVFCWHDSATNELLGYETPKGYCMIVKQNRNEIQIIKELAVDIAYLHDWYQNSISSEQWPDKYIDEVFHDFYLIPKEREE